ncbi:SMP-30/gluconolactonase/LRE family protein [Telmatospirillum sp.]|uniref:SMP-30/gluconolactonase/LRE family protein n=1 Tax=Telmatospirillum sp. TaxID=2079197 RepID=UPI00283DFB04|nr:SMP-30/gluconolactonase/LRE family protein [Telmatospirillum sp.]MDR3437929.1 SMP-30/gluconolactonase/LRE family protein [Telmatospirillum sp.]
MTTNSPILTRRSLFLAGGAALATATVTSKAFAQWKPSERIPDPAVHILDQSFNKYYVSSASVERIATGMRWCEGPVWFGDGRYLLWSDIPNNQIMRWDEQSGAVSPFRKPAGYANGNSRDALGRLITCEHENRRVTRTEFDGSTTVILDQFDGKPLNSPNDIVGKSDGSIWFTDPAFGPNVNESMARPELPGSVYRVDPQKGTVTLLAANIKGPNGLCFSPDESKLYIIESRTDPRRILVYDVVDNGTNIANGKVHIDCGKGTADGFRADEDGNLWCGWGEGSNELDGVMVFSSAGKAIGFISLPERCANVCFGGPKHNRLFMAASHSVYSLITKARGATIG